jgi:hypothetical protein
MGKRAADGQRLLNMDDGSFFVERVKERWPLNGRRHRSAP